MSYPIFAAILLAGLGLSIVLAVLRIAGVGLPWLAVAAPFCVCWIVDSYDYIFSVFAWHYHPPFPLSLEREIVAAGSFLVLALLAYRLIFWKRAAK